MSNENVTRVTVDASGYEAGMDRAKRSVESFLASQEAAARRTRAAQDAIAEAAVNGSKASAGAINSFVQSTARMADAAGKTRSQLLEQKAAALGVTDSMASYIARIRETENAHHKLNFATAGARREMLVLAHEASQGNWKRFAGSLMVLGERTDAMSMIMNKSVLSIGAVVGVVAMAASITYKAAEAMGKYGDEIDKISKRTGASTDAVQQWMFSAKASGVDAKEAAKSLGDLGEAQNKAIHGNKNAAAAFAAIGISLNDLKKNSPSDLMPRIADAFQQSADGAGKAAVANEIFGASGEDLIPVLNRGAAGLAALGIEARNAGAIIGNQAIAQMKAFEEQMNLSRAKMDAMSMSAKTELLPTILAVTNAFSDNATMGPVLHDFYAGVAQIAKGAAIGLYAVVTASREVAAGLNMISNIGRAGAIAQGIKEIGDAQSSYESFLKAINSPPREPMGPPDWARNKRNIDFSKGEHTPRVPHEKAYHDDAATRFIQQLRDQDASTRAALDSNGRLTEAEKRQAEFLQKIADLKERRILTVDEKSLLSAQDRIKAQFAINVAHERELKLKEDIQKLDERSAQIHAQIGNYQRNQVEQHQRELGAFGMGKDAMAQVQAVKSIYAEYERLQWQLEKETPKSARGSQQYLQAQADIKAGLDQSLKDYDDYYASLKAKQEDWTNGAATAFANYIDSAHNAAAEAQEVVTRSLKGMEDAMASLATTGKLNFKNLADGILADLNRMASRGLMSKLFENMSSIGGSMAGGLFASHTGATATAANALPGDALDNLMKLTKGFGTAGSAFGLGSLQKGIQQAATINAATATVATMTVGALVGASGLGGLGGSLDSILGSLGNGSFGGAFGFTDAALTGSADAVAAGAMADSSTSGMSALMGLFGGLPGRAGGGGVDGGTPYLVGEKGPELFIPGQSGGIVPNHALRTTGGDGGGQAGSRTHNYFMDISVPPGTTRATADQQARAIMERAQIAAARNG
ncbi:phage tail tape measure protein [Burkholderia sp. Ac-20353]|uniref:phage tail tape measure protein n=1 Tax=Burkholderia sp. Ac-20353 TaxID=2703894 RepID=UPI00197B19FF|nr:phage tail tape measure protein [Burkholderia sp. Ac-20353]MBN3789709.1 phage tail tape measure protein [Burkholderia sp. Ac-20353]